MLTTPGPLDFSDFAMRIIGLDTQGKGCELRGCWNIWPLFRWVIPWPIYGIMPEYKNLMSLVPIPSSTKKFTIKRYSESPGKFPRFEIAWLLTQVGVSPSQSLSNSIFYPNCQLASCWGPNIACLGIRGGPMKNSWIAFIVLPHN